MSDVAVVLSIDLTWHTKEGEGGEGGGWAVTGLHRAASTHEQCRLLFSGGSFSTEEFGGERKCRAFLKFQDYAAINQIFISWQTENCVPTPDHTGGLNLFF